MKPTKAIPFRQLPLSDNFMFGEVMRNEAICKLFLEELLHCEIEKLQFITKEADQSDTAFAHGIRLDVYLADENNTHYNIEMQNRKESLERRSRYYQSGIDRHLLEVGESYRALPESFIIFICNHDYLGAGKALYEKESWYKGTEIAYDDGSHVLILNTHYKDKADVSPAIAEYLDYIRDADDSKAFSTELAQLAKDLTAKVRYDPEKEVSYMTYTQKINEEREEAWFEGKAEGRAEGKVEGAQAELRSNVAKLLRSFSVDQIASLLDKPLSVIQGIANSLTTSKA